MVIKMYIDDFDFKNEIKRRKKNPLIKLRDLMGSFCRGAQFVISHIKNTKVNTYGVTAGHAAEE